LVERPHRVDGAADDRRAGEAEARLVGLPHELGAFLRPVLQQPRFLRDPVAVGAAPLRPVGGGGGQGEEDEERRQQTSTHHSPLALRSKQCRYSWSRMYSLPLATTGCVQ